MQGRERTWCGGDGGLLAGLLWRRWRRPSSRRLLTAISKWSGDVLSVRLLSFGFLNSLPASNLPFALGFLGFSGDSLLCYGVSLSSSLSSVFLVFLGFSFVSFFFVFWCAGLGVIYRANDRGCSLWSQGAGCAAAGRGAAVQAGLPRFRQRGGWSASVFCRWPTDMGPWLVGGLEGPAKN